MNKRKRFILSDKLHPQTISCVETRALPFGIDIEVGNVFDIDFSKKDISGILFQYPDTEGNVLDFTKVVEKAHQFGVSWHTHLNRDQIESDLSVPGIQGHQENALYKSFETSPHLLCLAVT